MGCRSNHLGGGLALLVEVRGLKPLLPSSFFLCLFFVVFVAAVEVAIGGPAAFFVWYDTSIVVVVSIWYALINSV